MKNKKCKGFSLAENVVAMAIVIIISVAMYSLLSYASGSQLKSNAVNQILGDVRNVNTILNASDFSSSNFEDLKNKVAWAYSDDISFIESVNSLDFYVFKNVKNELDYDGNIKIHFTLNIIANDVTMNAVGYFKDKQIYTMKEYTLKAVV